MGTSVSCCPSRPEDDSSCVGSPDDEESSLRSWDDAELDVQQSYVSLHVGDIVEFDLQNTAASLHIFDLQYSSASACIEDEVEYDLQNAGDLIDFLIHANIRLVELGHLKELARSGRLWPRRQEAEGDLVTLDQIKGWIIATDVGDRGTKPSVSILCRTAGKHNNIQTLLVFSCTVSWSIRSTQME